MSQVEEIQKQYEEGFPTFEKLFNMKSQELKAKLAEICGSAVPNEHIFKQGNEGGTVIKTSKDDVPHKVEICFYDTVTVSPWGINYKPEHGDGKKVIEFNKFFTLK